MNIKHALSIVICAALGACSGPDPSAQQDAAEARSAQEAGSSVAAGAVQPSSPHAARDSASGATKPMSDPPRADPNVAAVSNDPTSPAAPVRGIAIGEPNPSAPHSDNGLPRFDGYGDLRLGMTAAAARKAWQGELHGDAVESGACGYLLPKWSPGSGRFGLMFDGGRFVRYDVGTASESAPGGGRVGMTQAQVAALYPGRVSVQPHKYTAGGKTLRVPDSGAGKSALVFETDETGKITSWRVGLAPQVDYVEGCS